MHTSIQMSGSEWFGSTRGGLNRYFTDLFQALHARSDVSVTATAFGDAPRGGSSWGPIGGSTATRVRTSLTPKPAKGTILDRHFALYGPSLPFIGHHPLVTHFHGPWAAESAVAGSRGVAVKRRWERLRYRDSDLCIVLSAYTKDMLSHVYNIPAQRISVISPGVDLHRFTVAKAAGDRPIVLCVRRLDRRMGIDILLDAWPQVLIDVPDAQLVIVGTGSEGDALAAQSQEKGIDSSVRFAGNATDDELQALYRDCTLTVIPTRDLEGFGLIALESLAVGRAPIVTNTGGLPDSVRGFDDSLIVGVEDRDGLADRLIRGLSGEVPTPDACRTRAEEFSWQRCAQAHLDAYRQLS